jgi:hypothetical protein
MKHVLLVCHSQTGQLRQCADSLLAPMRAAGDEVEVEVLVPEPVEPYPFPWPLGKFFDVMPECVLDVPPAMKPMKPRREKYDLVILAWQVWFLSPALPVTGFLASDAAKVLADTPVVALCACRNMWHAGWLKLKAKLDALGARVIDHLVLIDAGPNWATFVTTPRWMWTGKKKGFGPFPDAGVSPEAIEGLKVPGALLLAALREDRLNGSVLRGTRPAPLLVVRKLVLPEVLTPPVFRMWARVIIAAGNLWKGLRFPTQLVFCAWLYVMVVTMLPVLILTAIVVRVGFKGWFNGRVELLAAPSGGDIA